MLLGAEDRADLALEGLLELAEMMAGRQVHADQMTGLCRWGTELIGCDRCSVLLRNEEGCFQGAFNFGNPSDIAELFADHRVSQDDPLIAAALASNSFVTVNDALGDPLFDPVLAQRARIRAIVVTALRFENGSPAGFITAEYNETPGQFTQLQSTLLRGVARLAQVLLQLNSVERQRDSGRATNEALQTRMRDLERMEALGRMAGGIAHDFNNMLAVMLGSAELLSNTSTLDGEDRILLQSLVDAGQRAADLTGQLLSFSRRGSTNPEVLDLSATIEDIKDLLERTMGVRVELDFDLAPDCLVLLERSQTEQVLLNLLINARDAMPLGGHVQIRVVPNELDAAASALLNVPVGRYIELHVTDNGSGIEETELPHLFEPFFSTHKADGSGLGLSTVYGIVVQAGGAISAHNNAGGGARFRIVLPERREVASTTTETGSASAPAGGSERLMLVDDNLALLPLMQRHLLSLGYDAVIVQQSIDALSMCTDGQKFDLVITDVIMPGMTGPELVAEIRRTQPDQKVLYMSAYAGDLLDGAPLDDSPSLLTKPFNMDDLAKRVRVALDKVDPA